MTTFQKRALLTAVIAGFAVIGYLMNSQQAVAQGPPNGLAVNIVNPVPLPVTGSTTVSGAVAATQSGAWNVGISGNSAYQTSVRGCDLAPVLPPVPAGKRLVIQSVSFEFIANRTVPGEVRMVIG